RMRSWAWRALTISHEYNPVETHGPYWLDMEFGKTEAEIIDKYITKRSWRVDPYLRITENINSQYRLFILDEEYKASQAIYVMDNNTGKVVGYSIFEEVSIESLSDIPNLPDYIPEPELLNLVKNLPVNDTYMENEIIQTPRAKIKFYEKFHSDIGFIERYGIMTYEFVTGTKVDRLILDSYYPASLEEYIGPKLVRDINNTLDWHDRYMSGEDLP